MYSLNDFFLDCLASYQFWFVFGNRLNENRGNGSMEKYVKHNLPVRIDPQDNLSVTPLCGEQLRKNATVEKNVKISVLCEIYGKLLTEKQLAILDDYYDQDLSLSEIAENQGITRQAVRDIIKKGENKLFEFEEKLEFMKKMYKQEEKISIILSELLKIQSKFTDNEVAEVLEHVRQELQCLV